MITRSFLFNSTGCLGQDKQVVPVGGSFTSPTDPCSKCICLDNGHSKCWKYSCRKPTCGDGEKLRRHKGKCCDSYECVRKPIELIDEGLYNTTKRRTKHSQNHVRINLTSCAKVNTRTIKCLQ